MGRIDSYPEYPDQNPNSPITLAYAEVIAQQGGITAEVDLTGLSVTVMVPEGRRIRVTGYTNWYSTVNNDRARLLISNGTNTQLQRAGSPLLQTSGLGSATAELILTPSAGVHTFKLRGMRDTGSGSLSLYAAGNVPAYILVEDITGMPVPVPPASVPVGQLAYAQVIANQANASTGNPGVDLAGLSVNFTVPAGRVIRVTGHITASSTAAGQVNLRIVDTVLGAIEEEFATIPANTNTGFTAMKVYSPSAGARTVKLTLGQDSGAGTVTMLAGASYPAFILVEDITPTPAPANTAPSSTLAYIEQPSSLTGVGTALTDVTGLSATVTVIEGRRIRVRGCIIALSGAAAENKCAAYILEGATRLGFGEEVLNPTVGTSSVIHPERILTPSAGTHTYKIAGQFAAGATNQFYRDPSNGQVCYILVEDITENSALISVNNSKGFMNHGAAAGAARPSGYASIEWYGSVEPTNAIAGDTWVDTS